MKLLLDTHILLWVLSDAAQLPQKVRYTTVWLRFGKFKSHTLHIRGK